MTPDPLLEGITARLRADLRPVRPRPATVVMVAAVVAVWAVVSVGAAAVLGFYGWHRLSAGAVAAIFAPLAVAAAVLAVASAGAMIPGSRRLAAPGLLAAVICGAMAAVFAALFDDYRTDRFVAQGWSCLRAGLMVAVPAAAATWVALRRGFAVDRRAAGVAIGGMAGMAGLAALELHCPNFRMAHVVVWHTGVVAAAAVAGWLSGVSANRSRTGRLL